LPTPSYLTCMEVFRRLDDFVDRELSPREISLVSEHLETCVTCARETRFEMRLLEGLRRKLRRVELPPGLRDRIAQRLRAAGDETGSSS